MPALDVPLGNDLLLYVVRRARDMNDSSVRVTVTTGRNPKPLTPNQVKDSSRGSAGETMPSARVDVDRRRPLAVAVKGTEHVKLPVGTRFPNEVALQLP